MRNPELMHKLNEDIELLTKKIAALQSDIASLPQSIKDYPVQLRKMLEQEEYLQVVVKKYNYELQEIYQDSNEEEIVNDYHALLPAQADVADDVEKIKNYVYLLRYFFWQMDIIKNSGYELSTLKKLLLEDKIPDDIPENSEPVLRDFLELNLRMREYEEAFPSGFVRKYASYNETCISCLLTDYPDLAEQIRQWDAFGKVQVELAELDYQKQIMFKKTQQEIDTMTKEIFALEGKLKNSFQYQEMTKDLSIMEMELQIKKKMLICLENFTPEKINELMDLQEQFENLILKAQEVDVDLQENAEKDVEKLSAELDAVRQQIQNTVREDRAADGVYESGWKIKMQVFKAQQYAERAAQVLPGKRERLDLNISLNKEILNTIESLKAIVSSHVVTSSGIGLYGQGVVHNISSPVAQAVSPAPSEKKPL